MLWISFSFSYCCLNSLGIILYSLRMWGKTKNMITSGKFVGWPLSRSGFEKQNNNNKQKIKWKPSWQWFLSQIIRFNTAWYAWLTFVDVWVMLCLYVPLHTSEILKINEFLRITFKLTSPQLYKKLVWLWKNRPLDGIVCCLNKFVNCYVTIFKALILY